MNNNKLEALYSEKFRLMAQIQEANRNGFKDLAERLDTRLIEVEFQIDEENIKMAGIKYPSQL